MKRLKQVTVRKGKGKGRVCLTLENEDRVFEAWLDPEQAERLAADIFTCRFALPVDFPDQVLVNRPPKWKKPPKEIFISFRTTMPRELGPRPLNFIRFVKDPVGRKRIEELDAVWLRKAAKETAKKQAERDKLVGGGFGPKRR